MKSSPAWFKTAVSFRVVFTAMFLFCGVSVLRADQIEMQNGDRYFGKITALNTNNLVLQSEVLGVVQLPRSKVATIHLGVNFTSGVNASTNGPVIANPKTAPETPASVRQLAAHTNLIAQVQSRYLADAGPEANAKFSELMAGLTSGAINVEDLRVEARKTLEQARELKRGLGETEGSSLDVYLSILEKFLKEPAKLETPTKAPRSAPKPASPGKEEE